VRIPKRRKWPGPRGLVAHGWFGVTALALVDQISCGGLASQETVTHDGGAASSGAWAPVTQVMATRDAGTNDARTNDPGMPDTGPHDAGSTFADAPTPKCGPIPTQLVDFKALAAQVGPDIWEARALAVDSNNVYFIFAGSLMSVPIRGGAVSSLAPAQADGGQSRGTDNVEDGPIVTSSTVVFHDNAYEGDQTLWAIPIEGGTPTTLATSNGFIAGFVADENNVYFSDATGVKSVPIVGGDVRLLTDAGSDGVPDLALVGSNLLYVTDEPGFLNIPTNGGPLTVLVTGGDAYLPFACNPDICWAANPSVGMSADWYNEIVRLSDAGVTTLVVGPTMGANTGTPLFTVTYDGANFFATFVCGGEIPRSTPCSVSMLRVPASGAPPVTLAPGLFLALDDECLYFSVAGAGTYYDYDGGILSDGIYSVDKSYTPQ
jgi:hypothetical protein